ncbi:GNAT family N-acetyltransferase [Nonomuraea phyllanthi]|uniref:GNAT family N-acetyltransferase n=1 Tax=Nonomuraea phyllanthi TaxID=2219224 RepID=A0A5C4V8M5_9ACTN|nr:GNAT family N-acetyltransferase [Nonomuraea phyllanthi]KAB8187602.1 GNAT family N-acetyltransferase [Nonomuraea phyllanthi]QFY14121.1 GNAT family N-acetyltransferase [Nonomuraea phyllanthi]
MLRTSASRVLDDSDRDEVLALLDTDPVANVFVSSRVRAVGLNPARLGGQMWGYGTRGGLVSLCYAGANLVPVNAGPEAVHAFADRARKQGRRCSSIVGPVDAVSLLWERLEPHWGRARAIRWAQPVMATSRRPPVPADPLVRRVRPEEFDILLPACVSMFTEEVGVSPNLGDGGALYRTRVAELIRIGRSYARIDQGRVVFKAEIGAVTPHACQIQGVWVAPELRGRGHAVAGMAAVVEAATSCYAPVVTLYVNDYNHSARAVYRKVGFQEVDTFMSVLF